MELAEKIQKLRKDRGLTQEQFAQQLFVSRTAVSKWETGRGTPSMESLQMIAKFFSVTLDDLLCSEEIIAIAENENQENIHRFASYMDGICNIAALMALFLPLFKTEINHVFYSVPLYTFHDWLAAFYWTMPIAMAICGVMQILLSKGERKRPGKVACVLGYLFNVSAVFAFILSGQPYPAAMFFALLLIKDAVLLIRKN